MFLLVSPTKIGTLRLPLRRHKSGDTSVSPVPPCRTHFSWFQIQRFHDFNKKTAHKGRLFYENGEPDSSKIARNSVININFFLSHYSEIMVMKEQVQMIKGMLAA